MTVRRFGPDNFHIDYSGSSDWPGPTQGMDMRLTEYDGFGGGTPYHSSLLGWGKASNSRLNARTMFGENTMENVQNRLIMSIEPDLFSPIGSPQKNWVPILDPGRSEAIRWIIHFSPFVVVDCGRLPSATEPPRAKKVTCTRVAPPVTTGGDNDVTLKLYAEKIGDELPAGSEHWRGSAPLVRLPSNPRLGLGTVHQRGYTKDGIFYDAYRHRFVLIDFDTTSLIAYTDEFAIFAAIDEVNWFEFVTGMTLFKKEEILLSFGYNDQEPWMAILPLKGILQWLKPINPDWKDVVDQARK